ncbi:MAG: hypothetical protein OXF79_04905 [Chloroflexi bacterium]|nr:hypothetical protein [Chloroflexota bacterium]
MTDRVPMSEALKADFADAFDSVSEGDEAEINQLTEEHDLSDPKRTKITPLPFSAAERLGIFEQLAMKTRK